MNPVNIYKFFKYLFQFASPSDSKSDSGNRYQEIAPIIDQIYKETEKVSGDYHNANVEKTPTFQELRKGTLTEQKDFMIQLVDYATAFREYYFQQVRPADHLSDLLHIIRHTLEALLKVKLPYSEPELMNFFIKYRIQLDNADARFHHYPLVETFAHVEWYVNKNGLSEQMKEHLYSLDNWLKTYPYPDHWGRRVHNLRRRIEQILFKVENPQATSTPFYFEDEDEFGVKLNQAVAAMEFGQRVMMYEMLHLASAGSEDKPSEAFLKNSKAIIERIGTETYQEVIHDWFEQYTSLELRERWIYGEILTYVFLEDVNINTLEGLLFTMAHFDDPQTLDLISRVAARSFKIIPKKSFASEKIGKAAVGLLEMRKSKEGFTSLVQLSRGTRALRALEILTPVIRRQENELGFSEKEV